MISSTQIEFTKNRISLFLSDSSYRQRGQIICLMLWKYCYMPWKLCILKTPYKVSLPSYVTSPTKEKTEYCRICISPNTLHRLACFSMKDIKSHTKQVDMRAWCVHEWLSIHRSLPFPTTKYEVSVRPDVVAQYPKLPVFR